MEELEREVVVEVPQGEAEPLLNGVTAHFPEGAWTGIVGANGAGKTTLLKLAAGVLAPTEGRIRQIGSARYAVQRTDAPPDDWLAFMDSWDPPAMDARALLGVEPEWTDRWDSLSHGERKRAQIAAALWRRPDVLALDEPTNHLDSHAKGVLLTALKSFRGVGLRRALFPVSFHFPAAHRDASGRRLRRHGTGSP